MVSIVVRDVTRLGVRRNNDQRNARPVAEVVQGLYISGVVVAAALILGDEDSGVLPQDGFAFTSSTIFLVKPSNKSSFDEDG